MSRRARGEHLDPLSIQIVHTICRCVRQAFLCGVDKLTGKSYEHRRQWIEDRLELLASVFAIDCLTYAIMSNHIHQVLRSRPDIVRSWSDEEVARRWLKLCPPQPNEPVTEEDVAKLVADTKSIEELRLRLSDISWWHRMFCQKIPNMANKEDGCTGRFWEGRFKDQLLLDEAAVLACAMYVDLNPIRAAMAESLEDSDFTGAKARIDDLKAIENGSDASSENTYATVPDPSTVDRSNRWERSEENRPSSGWLAPIEIDERCDPIGPDASSSGRRASLKGFVSMSITKYFDLLDWTGRQLRSVKRGSIPDSLSRILQPLVVAGENWSKLASNFEKLFKRAAGTPISLAAEAERRGQGWMQCPGSSCFA